MSKDGQSQGQAPEAGLSRSGTPLPEAATLESLQRQVCEALGDLQSGQAGDRSVGLARYRATLAALAQGVSETGRQRNPGGSFLARLGMADLAWVLHLNRDYQGVRALLPHLDALSPEPPADLIASRAPWPEGFDPALNRRAVWALEKLRTMAIRSRW